MKTDTVVLKWILMKHQNPAMRYMNIETLLYALLSHLCIYQLEAYNM